MEHPKITLNKHYVCTNAYTARIVEIFLELQRAQTVKNITEFCNIIGYKPSSWTSMSRGQRGFPKKKSIETKLIEHFNVRPEFLNQGVRPIFRNYYSMEQNHSDEKKVSGNLLYDPSIEYERSDNLLPFLSLGAQNDIFQNTLSGMQAKAWNSFAKRYTISPQLSYLLKKGNSWCFEVSSENMAPKLKYGDIILMDKVERENWAQLKTNHTIYVILYNSQFILGRMKFNGMQLTGMLMLEDNLQNQTVVIADSISSLWVVKAIIYSNLE